jgi:hypothetical protein
MWGKLALLAILPLAVIATATDAGAQGAASGTTAPGPTRPKPKPASSGETPSDAGGPVAPARAAPPPLPASGAPVPPWDGTATMGTSLMPAAPPPPPPIAPSPATPGYDSARLERFEERVHTLEARLDTAERTNAANDEKLAWLRKFRVSGYVQNQLLWQWFNSAGSPNASGGVLPVGIGPDSTIAQPTFNSSGVPTTNGVPITTNGDYFRLRRVRLKTEFMPTDYARVVFEIDPTPFSWVGVNTIARQTEAQGIVHWACDISTNFALGIFKIPYGYEILQSDVDRPFIERSWGERNMVPAEFDTGARAYTTAFRDRLTFQVAVINGVTEGEKSFALIPDQNKGKDVVGRLNFNFGAFDVGVSGYYGQGQIVDGVGLKFKQFPRSAGNAEIGVHHTFLRALGQTRVLAEGNLAMNMDRGVNYAFALPAFPTDVINGSVVNQIERSTWVRVEQDMSEWFTLALRYDYYTPDTSQENDGRSTYGAVGVLHFTKGLQYMLEGDFGIDNVHKPGTVAPSKQITQLSNVLQVRF